MEFLNHILEYIVEIGILLFEFVGVGVIILTCVVSVYKCVGRKPDTRIYLAKGFAMGLEFKLGSEILRTVVVREWKEIAIVAGIIYVPTDFDTKRKALSRANAAEKGLK